MTNNYKNTSGGSKVPRSKVTISDAEYIADHYVYWRVMGLSNREICKNTNIEGMLLRKILKSHFVKFLE